MTINRTHVLSAVNDRQKRRRIGGKDEVREVRERERETERDIERKKERYRFRKKAHLNLVE